MKETSDFYRYTGSIQQLAYARRICYDEGRARGLHAVVPAGEVQQLFRSALEPVRLGAYVGDELAHRGLVHVGVLLYAVRQQPDGGERGLELVRGVRDKAAALLLRGLQGLRHVVELLAELGQLVVALGL